MDIEAFLACDAATDQFGKLNVLGSFDAFVVPRVPHVHPQFSVALRLRFRRSESGDHPFRFNLINEDGKPVIKPLDGNLSIKIRPDDEFGVVNIVFNLRDTRFESFGRYSLDLLVDGSPRGSLPLWVRQAPPPA